jgi:hypothetical protein
MGAVQDKLGMIWGMLRHDPAAVLGFVLIGVSGVFLLHIQFKMREVGWKTNPVFSRPQDWGWPVEYLKIRKKHGWSAWAAYLVWPCLIAGIVLLVFGLTRLPD